MVYKIFCNPLVLIIQKMTRIIFLFVIVSSVNSYAQFGEQQIISIDPDLSGVRSVHAADLDGDGDMDVLSASEGDDKVAWYENTDGLGNFGSQQIITQSLQAAIDVYAVDLDGDEDMDILVASKGFSQNDGKIVWFENTDGLGNFGSQQIITTLTNGAISVYAADLDGDGDMDVLSASFSDHKIAWYENLDGLGNFGSQQVLTVSALSVRDVYAKDLDGDGDMDVLAAAKQDDRIVWHENLDGLGNFGSQQIITTLTDGALSVFATDLDGDGDMDVLSASFHDNKIAWYENLDGLGSFGAQQIITNNALSARDVYAADLDGDGDMDVLAASAAIDEVIWFENTDGQGNFGSEQIITNIANSVLSVFAIDLDGDGDIDVLSASPSDDKVSWHKNLDGQGTFGAQQVITTGLEGERVVFAADLDNDGDMDVLSAYQEDHQGEIVWYENLDGLGNFGTHQVITTEAAAPRAVYAADLDGDGDMDVLSASIVDHKIAWYENLTILGVSENNFANLYIYPNPTNDYLYIRASLKTSISS